ncbi:MAG: hypothetical protein LUO89_00225, partial [Methanothrix sp.]|nr:hypothetical protein [Methanothrix sp.]
MSGETYYARTDGFFASFMQRYSVLAATMVGVAFEAGVRVDWAEGVTLPPSTAPRSSKLLNSMTWSFP